jgi:menaquinol-cytochrome c reductase iron-sulfur subunit
MLEQSQTEPQTRRGFYLTVINLLGAALGAAVAIPAAAYLLIRPKGAADEGWSEVAQLDQLKVGKPEQILYVRKRVDGWHKVTEKVATWLVKTDEHTVVAFNPACTHLACPYHWDDKAHQFACPCHDSKFSIEGKVLAGPAPRPLDRYVAKVEDGKILIGSEVVDQG